MEELEKLKDGTVLYTGSMQGVDYGMAVAEFCK